MYCLFENILYFYEVVHASIMLDSITGAAPMKSTCMRSMSDWSIYTYTSTLCTSKPED